MNTPSSRPRVRLRAAQQKRTRSDSATTVESLRQLMRDFVRERQWEKYHTPQNLAAAVSVEAAELLELFQWFTPDEAREKALREPRLRQAIGEEIADVFLFLISMVNALDMDLSEIVSQKMQKNRLKYPPAGRFRCKAASRRQARLLGFVAAR